MKLAEYRLKREHTDMKEKLDYYTRLLKSTQDQAHSLEQTAAKSESQMLKEREEFRKRDMERKEFFMKGSRWNEEPDMFKKRDADRAHSIGNQISQAQGHTTPFGLGHVDQEQLQRALELKRMD